MFLDFGFSFLYQILKMKCSARYIRKTEAIATWHTLSDLLYSRHLAIR